MTPDGENAQVQITAQVVPDQSPDWPNGAPAWTGVAASDGTTATLSTEIAGTYTVSCAYGNMKSLVVQVIGIESVRARRADESQTCRTAPVRLLQPPSPQAAWTTTSTRPTWSSSSTPSPLAPFSLPIEVVVTNADGYPDEPVPATLCVDGTPRFHR